MATEFFAVFLLTILITRVILFFWPIPAPTIKKFRMHHYMFGIGGIIVGIFLNSVFVYAVGWGLFIDELTYILIKGKNHNDNYSKASLVGTIFFIVVIYLIRDHLLKLLMYR